MSIILKKTFVRAIRCVYICANRDYPTTVSITAERRKPITTCKEYQFAIIEDDYDYDFQFEGLAMLPMVARMQMEW
jgi:GntR family transcriptional regulator/MocR family aminotransferase